MKDRIERILRYYSVSPSQFADELGVQRSNISHILSERNKPSLDFIQKILNRFKDLNPDWLLSGKGEMLRSTQQSQSLFENVPQNTQTTGSKIDETRIENSQPVEKVENLLKITPITRNPEKKSVVNEPINEKAELSFDTIEKQGKAVEKIVIFYTDKSFEIYHT